MTRTVFVAICCTIVATLHVTGNVWRFESTEGDAAIFTTRNPVHLNYLNETDFLRWETEDYICTIDNVSLPQTELRCRIPGFIQVAAMSNSDSYMGKYLHITPSVECFQWHIHRNPLSFSNESQVKQRLHLHQMELSMWIVDMRYASEDEKLNRARSPSNYSRALTKQFHTLGQYPRITFIYEDVLGYEDKYRVVEFNESKGVWRGYLEGMAYRQPKILISGLPIPLFDCLIRDEYAMLPTIMPDESAGPDGQVDDQGKMSLLRANVTRPVLVKDACAETPGMLLTPDSVYVTWDGFVSSEPLYIPDNGTFSDVPVVESAAFTYKYLVLLINSTLHFMDKSTRKWQSYKVPTDDPVIGLKGRDTCHTGHFYVLLEEAIAVWTHQVVFISVNHSKSADGDLHEVQLHTLLTAELDTPSKVTIREVSFHSLPHLLCILLDFGDKNSLDLVIYDISIRNATMVIQSGDIYAEFRSNLMVLNSGEFSFLTWDDSRMFYAPGNREVMLFNGLQLVKDGETIQQVVVNPKDDMIVRTSLNRLHYGWPTNPIFTELDSGELPDTPMELWVDARGSIYAITLNDSMVTRRVIPLVQEIVSISIPDTECPYLEFSTDLDRNLIHIDKMETFVLTARLIQRTRKQQEDIKFQVIFNKSDILTMSSTSHTESYGVNVVHSMEMTFTQDWDLNPHKLSYADLFAVSVRTFSVQLIPTKTHPLCKNTSLLIRISVGCRAGWNIRIKPPKGHDKNGCAFFKQYTIAGKYKLNDWGGGTPDITMPYDFKHLGCPFQLNNIDVFVPEVMLYDFDKFVRPVESNVILWEQHGRHNYKYNNTMYNVLCWREAQTWDKMVRKANADISKDQIWGPENYESCFDRTHGLATKAELSKPYQIINRTSRVGIRFPAECYGVYVFSIKVLDPDFSFCTLMTQFAVIIPQRGFSVIVVSLTLLGISFFMFVLLVGSYIYFTNHVYLRID